MKKLFTPIFALALCLYAEAQTMNTPIGKAYLAYDAAFMTDFDNREYDKTDLDYSRTLFGAGLEAAIGVGYKTDRVHHRVVAGASTLFEFGGDIKVKPVAYYQFSSKLKKSKFSLDAGIFPRTKSKAFYSDAFFSAANRFYKSTYSGFLFDWTGRNFYHEFGVDWMGQLRSASPATREEFMVFAGGHHRFLPGLKLGYSAYMHHYACNAAGTATNVVDDILVNPYLDMDFNHFTGMQRLLTRFGYIQAAQRDRAAEGGMKLPAKGEFLFEARKWNVGVVNDLFFGADLMPLFDAPRPEGGSYGTGLYNGELFMRNAGGRDFGIYDRVSVYYEPNIVRSLNLRLQINCHFNNAGFAGWQQVIMVTYYIGR